MSHLTFHFCWSNLRFIYKAFEFSRQKRPKIALVGAAGDFWRPMLQNETFLVNVKHCVLALLKKPKSISKNGSFQEILIRSLFLIFSNALLFCLICAPGSVWIKRSAWGTFTERSKKEVSLSWLNASDKWVCNKMTLFHKLLQKTIDMLSFEQCLLLVGMQKECKYCCRCITSFWIIHAHAQTH